MTDRPSRIAALNDLCRQGRDPSARIVVTATCLAALTIGDGFLDEIRAQAELLALLHNYVPRPEDGEERSRGVLSLRGRTVWFRIDYYDPALEWGSEDPTDPTITIRVLTLMLPEDD